MASQNKVTLKAKDGTTVEFYDEIKAQGGVKDVYFSCDKTYVVAFYRKSLDANDKVRLENIVNVFHKRIFDGTSVGDYWKESLVLPDRIVEWNGSTTRNSSSKEARSTERKKKENGLHRQS